MTLNSDIIEAGQFSVDGKQYKTVDEKHVPYASSAEYLSLIPLTRRHVGQIGYIANGSIVETWQFVGGIADINFVLVSSSSPSSSGDLQAVTTVGNVTDKKIQIANLNISDIKEFANNTAAILGGLFNGDVYNIPIDSDIYKLAIVKSPVISFKLKPPTSYFETTLTGSSPIHIVANWGDNTFEEYTASPLFLYGLHTWAEELNYPVNISVFNPDDLNSIDFSYIVITNEQIAKLATFINLHTIGFSNSGISNFDPKVYPPLTSLAFSNETAAFIFDPTVALPASLVQLTIVVQGMTSFDPVIPLPALMELNLSYCNLSGGLAPVNNPLPASLIRIFISNTNMDQLAVDTTFVALDAMTFTNPVNLTIDQYPAVVASGAGATARASLITKGWTITD